MQENELKIIAGIQQGKHEDFALLYDQYQNPIYRFIYYRTHHTQTAEDITSLVFMKALENMGSFEASKGTFSAWLYRIARNAIIDHYRSSHSTEDIANAWDMPAAANVERDVQTAMNLDEVRKYLQELSPQQRDIVIMRVWDGLSHREIAEVLGISEANSKMIFSRTLGKLQKEVIYVAVILLLLIPT